MTMKINCWECCYESTITKKLLTECKKKANSKAVKPIDDIIKVGVVSGCGMCPQSQLEKVGTYGEVCIREISCILASAIIDQHIVYPMHVQARGLCDHSVSV